MNANQNPFRSSAIDNIRYQLSADEKTGLIDQLEEQGWRSSIVGPRGTGKTTLLEDLEPSIQARGWRTQWVRLKEETPRREKRSELQSLTSYSRDTMILFDGGETLRLMDWILLLERIRHLGGIIMTLHRPRGLPILYETEPDAYLAHALSCQLLGRYDPQLSYIVADAFEAHNGDMREVFRHCYLAAAKGELSPPSVKDPCDKKETN